MASRIRYVPNPLSITGCVLWLDAADASTITGTSSVTAWRDKSTRGYVATSTGGRNPSYASSIQNGLSAIQYSTTTSSIIPSFVLAQSMSIFMMYCPIGQNIGPLIEHGPDENSNPGFYLYTGGSNNFAINSGTGHIGFTSGSYGSSGVWKIYQGLNRDPAQGNNMSVYSNGTLGGTGSPNTGSTVVTNTLNIGSRNNTNYATANAYLGELIIFNVALTNVERQQVEGYLAQKWGITSSLPAQHPGLTLMKLQRSIVPYWTQFRPTSIAGCQLWLDATDVTGNGAVTANEASITSWTNKIIGGATGLVTVTSSGSTYSTTAVNGKPGISLITNPFGYSAGSTINNWQETFVVANWTGPSVFGDYDGLITGINNSEGTASGIGIIGNAGGTSWYASWGTMTLNGTTTNTALPTIKNNPFIIRCSAASPVSINGMRIGCDRSYTTSRNWKGSISEVISYNVALTSTQRQTIESYLAQKWGITNLLPSGHLNSTKPAGMPMEVSNVMNVKLTTGSTFSPSYVETLQLWLDASDPAGTGIAPSQGTTIQTWVDKSRYNRNAIATATTTNYYDATRTLSPYPCIVTKYNTPAWNTSQFTDSDTVMTFVLHMNRELNQGSSGNVIIDSTISTFSPNRVVLYCSNGIATTLTVHDGSDYNTSQTVSLQSASTEDVFVIMCRGTNGSTSVSRKYTTSSSYVETSIAGFAPNANFYTNLSICSQQSLGIQYNWAGTASQIMLFSDIPSDFTLSAIVNWCLKK